MMLAVAHPSTDLCFSQETKLRIPNDRSDIPGPSCHEAAELTVALEGSATIRLLLLFSPTCSTIVAPSQKQPRQSRYYHMRFFMLGILKAETANEVCHRQRW